MRAGGLLAGFRKGISHIADPGRPYTQNGLVCIKLFNLLIKEMGPDFLNKGIFLSPAELMSLAEDIQSSCATSLPATVWDNESIDFEHLGTVHLPGAADPIFMRATFDSPP
jgi:hypothetical protein